MKLPHHYVRYSTIPKRRQHGRKLGKKVHGLLYLKRMTDMTSNCRPIAVLPFGDKIYERLLRKQITNFMDPILTDNLTVYSCETTLVRLVGGKWNQIVENWLACLLAIFIRYLIHFTFLFLQTNQNHIASRIKLSTQFAPIFIIGKIGSNSHQC